MNQAGREVMLKSEAMAMPTYVMSYVRLPENLCSEIKAVMVAFWWGGKEGKRKMHWMSWDRLCEKKSGGGLGFRDPSAFNLALLVKQGWRLLTDETSLLFKVLKAKYFPNSSFLEVGAGSNPSWTWQSILEGRKVLVEGVRWRG